MLAWPTKIVTAKIEILGLDSAPEAMSTCDYDARRNATMAYQRGMGTRRDLTCHWFGEVNWRVAVTFDPVFLSRLQFGFVITFQCGSPEERIPGLVLGTLTGWGGSLTYTR